MIRTSHTHISEHPGLLSWAPWLHSAYSARNGYTPYSQTVIILYISIKVSNITFSNICINHCGNLGSISVSSPISCVILGKPFDISGSELHHVKERYSNHSAWLVENICETTGAKALWKIVGLFLSTQEQDSSNRTQFYPVPFANGIWRKSLILSEIQNTRQRSNVEKN